MLEKRTQDYEIQLTKTNDELRTTKEQLAKVTQQETALVQQNAKMSVELVAGEKGQMVLENELKSVKDQLKLREAEVHKMKDEIEKMKTKHKTATEGLGKEMEEKNKTVKEYQDKVCYIMSCVSIQPWLKTPTMSCLQVSKMTEKLQKLTKSLAEEKAAAEKLQKSNSSQINQQTSDNRKMALEISKLKVFTKQKK